MDERHSPQHKMNGTPVDTRADFWKLRIVRQPCSTTKIYLFPSFLEWLDERPQLALSEVLARKESQLGLEVPKEVASMNRSKSHNVDILTAYVSGRSDTRPSSKDILNHLQRTYVELYKREGQSRSRDLISLIDASLLLNEPEFAWKLSKENNYEHDLLELHRNISNKDKWDNYVTSLMLRLSSCGTPSKEMWEAATVTRLLCKIMAGPNWRRRAAIAEMAAFGLRIDAMVLAKLYLTNDEICEQLSRECSCLLKKSMTSEVDKISRIVEMASAPIFDRGMLRCIDQLSCYRILRIDFALNESKPLEKKLIGRLELAQHVRFVIADALAYRNFADLEFIAEDAASHLDKRKAKCFPSSDVLYFLMSLAMVTEATRAIFHAKPASIGWKRQSDESDKLGSLLQQHPNGYIGGLVEMWLKRGSLIEIADSKDVYRQRSLHSVVDAIADVLREDTTFNPVCRGLLIFACDLVCSTLEAIFGHHCQRIDELIKNTGLDRLTADKLICKLSKGILSPHANTRLASILDQLSALPVVDTPDKGGRGNEDIKNDGNSTCENVMDFELAEVPSFLTEATKSSTSQEETSDIKGSGFKRCFENEGDDIVSQSRCKDKAELDNPQLEENAQESDRAAASDQSSDLNEVSSVAPSRSVCEQVETLMAGVKYCKEREHGKEKRRAKEASENRQTEDTRDVPVGTVTENKEEHHVVEEEKRKIMSDEVASGNIEEISQEETMGEESGNWPASAPLLLMQPGSRFGAARETDQSQRGYPPDLLEQLHPTIDQAVIPIETETSENEAEKIVEPERSECAKILSDDHLDFSSNQDQSLRTKWLPDNGFRTSKSLDNLVEAVDGDRKDAKAAVVSEEHTSEENEWRSSNEDITSTWTPVDDVPGSKDETDVTEKQIRADEIPVSNSAALQKKNETDVPLSGEVKTIEHVSPTMDKGKAIIKDTSFAPPMERVNTPEKPIISFDADDNPDGFDGDQFDRPKVFTTTRELVFCTKTFDGEDLSDPSTDDDIAGVFMRSADREATIEKEPSINGREQPAGIKAKFATPSQDSVSQMAKTEIPLPDKETIVSDIAAVNLRRESLHESDEKVNDTAKNRRESENDSTIVTKSRRESESAGLPPDVEKTPLSNEPAKGDDGWDDIEEVKKASAQDTEDQVRKPDEYSKPSPPQPRFLSGGFESTGSPFGAFGGGGGHSEKENSYGSHGSFRERKNSYEGERSGGGGGRGGFRGGGRTGGRGYDSAPRDNYRDRDRDRDRDSRDGFRGRGGYGGGGRGSRSYENRGGFHGNRA